MLLKDLPEIFNAEKTARETTALGSQLSLVPYVVGAKQPLASIPVGLQLGQLPAGILSHTWHLGA